MPQPLSKSEEGANARGPADGARFSRAVRREHGAPGSNASGFEDPEFLRTILEGTSHTTGEEFFESLVKHLATAMHVHHAFVAEFVGPLQTQRVRTLAFWSVDRIVPNIEWDLRGTPCEDVYRTGLCHYPNHVYQRFSDDRPLVEMRIESYLGVPLLDGSGQFLGHLAVFDEQPMEGPEFSLACMEGVAERAGEVRAEAPGDSARIWAFKIFAARAAAELQRLGVERRLRQSEENFRDLFDEAPIAYVHEDTETRFISANKAAIKLLGLKPEEVVGTVGRSLLAPTQRTHDLVDDAFADIKKGKERGGFEIELRRKDNGQPVWVQFFSKPDPDGKHTRTMIIDVTARVLAEKERNRLHQQNLYLQEEIKSEYNFEEIIGNAPPLRKVLKQVQQVAGTDSTVLIVGETGTGKELIARAIHSRSRRKDRPLIKLNCAALPAGLVESELFGHEKGAFTGALEKRIGRFALAHGGTIFLDEIGDMPAEVQVKLLRVLQEQEFEPVGSAKTMKVDVRVIAATNRDLSRAVAEGTFRADLFYRLNVFPIALPPLRERSGDISLLVHYFVNKYAARIGRPMSEVNEESLQRLTEYHWPGNIRELENIVERAVILSPGPVLEIDPDLLAVGDRSKGPQAAANSSLQAPKPAVLPVTLADAQRKQILDTLIQTNWVIDGPHGAAKILGLHPNTLRSRMKKLDIKRPQS
jgi:formate hydrogenlyase transcriptional activator